MNLFENFIFIFSLIGISILFILLFIALGDTLTIKEIGMEKVPCIDNEGNPFEDELCEETIHCSFLGWATDKKCSEVER